MKKFITQRWLCVIAMLLIILQSNSSIAQTRLSDTESRFYTDLIPNNTTDIILTGANSTADSQTLQNAIDSVSGQGGGIITINNNSSNSIGVYYILDVELKSNIHLKIAADVELVARSNGKMFYVGENVFVENVAITNIDTDNTDPSTWAKINLAQGTDFSKNWSFMKVGHANNFQISGLRIEDNHSRISAITMSADATQNKNNIPTNGVVKDIVMSISHVGFGVAQVQASKTVLFRNLDGTGGVTLRLESGIGFLNQDTLLTLDDIVARDIISRNGDGATVLSPHRLNQGVVDLDGLYAYSSTFAVSIAAGFLDNTGSGTNLGVFNEDSYIGDIYVFGGNFSQVKSKNFNFYDCTTRQALVDRCGKSLKKPALDIEAFPAQSISVIKDIANSSNGCSGGSGSGCYDVTFGGTITKGNADFAFPSQNTIDNSDKITGSCSLTVRDNCAQPYPVAAFTTSASGSSITFDASGSSDNGSIVEYQWIFGDGTMGYGQSITHNYNQSGGYFVTLSVRDNQHAVTTTFETISVSGAANIPVTGVSVSPETLTLDVNETSNLTATITPANATDASVVWSSDNESIATVDASGIVTAVATGNATITVTTNDGSFTDTTSVTVNEETISVTGVSVSLANVTLDVNQTSNLTATVTPANASDTSVVWSSDNTSIATVDASGVVTAISAGNAIITVTTNDGSFTDTTSVTVNEETISVTGVNISPATITLDVNETSNLTATVSPANASDASVVWSSNNISVATVNSSGVVTAISDGLATITATTNDGNFTDTTSVTVNQPQTGGFTELIYDDFEGGFGNWIDGGTDALLYTGGTHAHQGSNAIDLQDNTGTSLITTNNLALSGITEVKVEFWYKAVSMDNSNEDFWLQISTNGGSSYTTVETWARTTDFENNIFYEDAFTISGITLNNQTRLRFRCDASGNADDVYLDEIRVSVSSDPGSTVDVTGVSLSPASVSIESGQTSNLSETVSPSNATNQSVTWSSNNTSVATVNSSGVVTGVSVGSAIITVTTVDGNFTDTSAITVTQPQVTYCSSNGNNTNDEFISRFQLNTIDNSTGASNGGYGDFTSINTSLNKSQNYTLTVTPTWTGTLYNEAYSVWIDYNQDGDFNDSGEQIWSNGPTQNSSVSGSFTVPSSATNGNTRMRVTMRYNTAPSSCGSFNYGEVEDYTINISNSSARNSLKKSTLSDTETITSITNVYPNPFKNELYINFNQNHKVQKIMLMDINGRIILQKSVKNNESKLKLNLDEYSIQKGMYLLQIINLDSIKTIKVIKD